MVFPSTLKPKQARVRRKGGAEHNVDESGVQPRFSNPARQRKDHHCKTLQMDYLSCKDSNAGA
jgi:hypothetical protein